MVFLTTSPFPNILSNFWTLANLIGKHYLQSNFNLHFSYFECDRTSLYTFKSHLYFLPLDVFCYPFISFGLHNTLISCRASINKVYIFNDKDQTKHLRYWRKATGWCMAKLHPAFSSHLPCITSMEPEICRKEEQGNRVLRPGYSPWL